MVTLVVALRMDKTGISTRVQFGNCTRIQDRADEGLNQGSDNEQWTYSRGRREN